MNEYAAMVRAAQAARRRARLITVLLLSVVFALLSVLGWFAWTILGAKDKQETVASAPTAEEASVAAPVSSAKSTRRPLKTSPVALRPANYKNRLVAVGETKRRLAGSGFLVKLDGKTYLVLNEHVTRWPIELFETVLALNGTRLTLGPMEVAEGEDLVRFEVDGALPAIDVADVEPLENEFVALLGGNVANGDALKVNSRIATVSPNRLDIDGNVMPGYTGGPVLNDEGKAYGALVFEDAGSTRYVDERDWAGLGPQLGGARRLYAVRFKGLKWAPVEWTAYREQVELLDDLVQFCKRLAAFVAAKGEVKRAISNFPVVYRETDKKFFQRQEEAFRPQLLALGKLWANIPKLKREMNWSRTSTARNAAEVLATAQRDFNAASEAMSQTLLKAFEETKAKFEQTKWSLSRFTSETTKFVPMKWYLEWLDEQILAQKRALGEKIAVSDVPTDAPVDDRPFFERVKGSLVIVKAGQNIGAGSLVKMDGAVWLVTSERVLRGAEPFSAKTLDGRALTFSPQIEVASGRDLARLRVKGESPALEWKGGTARKDQQIRIFQMGRQNGSGTLSDEYGTIDGIGLDRFDVSGSFSPDDSGGAVLDYQGGLLGVIAYDMRDLIPERLELGSTRIRSEAIKPYCVRLDGVKWQQIAWKDYATRAQALTACEQYIAKCMMVCFGRQEEIRGHELNAMALNGEIKAFDLRSALSAIANADRRLRETVETYNSLREACNRIKRGALNDPRGKLKSLWKIYQGRRTQCAKVRRAALKTGQTFLTSDWKLENLQNEANLQRRWFEMHLNRFEEEFSDDLLGPRLSQGDFDM